MDQNLSEEDFDVTQFLKTALSQKNKGGSEDIRKLRELRTNIQALAEESSQSIKRNVFQNYTQFIDTAKEISYLEGEMYQLNHLLTEQKNLIEKMMDTSFTENDKGGTSGPSSRKIVGGDEKRRSMQALLEKVEGTSHLADSASRYLILESDLTELHSENGAVMRTIHAFLLNDGLMLTTWIPHRLGPMRYKFQCFFPLDSLAVVNVKDSMSVANAFKLLVFPEHKLLASRGQSGSEASLAEVEWLKELPDELDVCIAQRDFDSAIELLFEGRENLQDCSDAVVAQDVREKLVQKERNLVEVLSRELKVTNEKSLQGGPKATRKAITLLNKLGKSSQACDLYLKNRSAVIRQSVKELRLAEDPLNYLRRLTSIVCGNIAEVAREFTKLFSGNTGCYSVLLLWSSGELKNLVNLVLRHVIDPGPSLSVIGHSIKFVYSSCEELSHLGLDLIFELDNLFTPQLERVILEHGQNHLDAMKLRISEDKWKPYNLQSEAALSKFLEEMREGGLILDNFLCVKNIVGDYLPGYGAVFIERCRLWLTLQACHFARGSIPLAKDLANLRLIDLKQRVDDLLSDIWRVQLGHIRQGLASKGKAPQQKTVAEQCARFIIGQVLPLCENHYCKAIGDRSGNWTPLQDLLARDFPALAPFRAHMSSSQQFEIVGDV